MTNRPPVGAQRLLRAILRVRRQGTDRTLQRIDKEDSDLSEFVIEELTRVYHSLLDLRGPPRRTRRVYRRVKQLVLVCIQALRSVRPLPPVSTRRRPKTRAHR